MCRCQARDAIRCDSRAVDWSLVATILGGLLTAWALLVGILWVFRPPDVSLGELMRVIPDVLRLVHQLVADRTIRLRVRVALVGLLAWLVNPVDLIPEFVPVLGPLDDVVVAVLVLRYVERQLGETVFKRHWPGTMDGYMLLRSALHPGRNG